MSAVTVNDDGLVLRLYIQPKASRDSIVGLHGDEVKVAITAPPVDGQANSHLVKFLGKQSHPLPVAGGESGAAADRPAES
ncbi:DUF167 family protein, partial [Escherichia sp. TWPC-MK]